MKDNSKIGFIQVYTKNIPESIEDGKIIIDYTQESPRLRYYNKKDGENSGVWITVDGSDSPATPASLSDLESLLRGRDWNIVGRLYTTKNHKIKTTNQSSTTTQTTSYPMTTTPIPGENKDKPEELFMYFPKDCFSSFSNPIVRLDESQEEYDSFKITEDLVVDDGVEGNSFSDIYEMFINMKMLDQSSNLGALYYYDVVSVRDLEKESSIIDLITKPGSSYTSVVNLNNLIHLMQNTRSNHFDCSCNLVFGVDYTISGQIYTKELSFVPFTISEDGSIESDDLIIKVSNDVTADYHDRCLRVFPTSKRVTECIISYCYISYGGLY